MPIQRIDLFKKTTTRKTTAQLNSSVVSWLSNFCAPLGFLLIEVHKFYVLYSA